ncbi:MAG: tyrosine-type recombinase/integrase, partial [Candidatus Acidiferrales bacterium]
EMVRLIEAAKNPLERAVAQVLYSTGMRVSELVKMRIEEINFESRIMRVIKGKGGKSRIVPFGEHAADAIRKYHEWRKLQAGWLFESAGHGIRTDYPNIYVCCGRAHFPQRIQQGPPILRQVGRHFRKYAKPTWYVQVTLAGKRYHRQIGRVANFPTLEDARREFDRLYGKHPGYHPPEPRALCDREIRYILKRMAARARLTGVTPHALRRAIATHMLESGASMRVVQEILGHERLTTTALYTLLSAAKLSKVHRECHPHGGDDNAKS